MKAICPKCTEIVEVTPKRKDTVTVNGRVLKNKLITICNKCKSDVGILGPSFDNLDKELKEFNKFEANTPAKATDIHTLFANLKKKYFK